MKWKIPSLKTWLTLPFLSGCLFLLVVLFQASLLTRAPFFYPAIKVVFLGFSMLLLAGLAAKLRREKVLILALVLIVLLRIPFYLNYRGLITTSDNALEALQSIEVQDTHIPSFFLLEDIRHAGTIKQFCLAFFNDLFGASYLNYVLLQLAVFVAFLFVLQEFFKPAIGRTVLLLFLITQFAFIETFFDYSLSLRGGPYLEMILFFALGAILFDFSFEDKTRNFLAFAFMFFSIYIHPLSSLFVGSFLLCSTVYALQGRKLGRMSAQAAAGAAAGLVHFFYYLFFFNPKPPLTGTWEKIGLSPTTIISSAYLREFIKNIRGCFRNIFSYEFSYLQAIMPKGKGQIILRVLNETTIYLSLAVLIAGAALVVRKIIRLALKKEDLQIVDWISIFFFFLLGAVLVKTFLLHPWRQEPRHNFDLMFLVMTSYLIVFSRLFRRLTLASWKTPAAAVLFLALTAPHAIYFYQNVRHKDTSYGELMAALGRNKVRFLTSDFNLAYTVFFLSHRKIQVSSSLGPLTISNFYPEMSARVDRLPEDGKAYLFHSDAYALSSKVKDTNSFIKTRLLQSFQEKGILHRTAKFQDFVLFVPRRSKK